MNCCGIKVRCGIDPNHIDPFDIGRRFVPFRAGEWRLPFTRVYTLRYQITPRWGCRNRIGVRFPSGRFDHKLLVQMYPAPKGRNLSARMLSDKLQPAPKGRNLPARMLSDKLQPAPKGRNLPTRMIGDKLHPAPKGRNLPAKGVSPGTTAPSVFRP